MFGVYQGNIWLLSTSGMESWNVSAIRHSEKADGEQSGVASGLIHTSRRWSRI